MIYYLSKYWLYSRLIADDEAGSPPIFQDDFAGMVSVSVQIVVGAILAMKARTLCRWILRVRETRPKGGS